MIGIFIFENPPAVSRVDVDEPCKTDAVSTVGVPRFRGTHTGPILNMQTTRFVRHARGLWKYYTVRDKHRTTRNNQYVRLQRTVRV
jgi:hypothetical protein